MIRAFKPLPRRPRYEYAKKKAYELLSDLDIREYPIDIFNIYKIKNIKYFSLSEAAPLISLYPNLSNLLTKDAFDKNDMDAFTTIIPNFGYVTFYDDQKSDDRIRFTLAHELGHILLNHCIDFEETLYFRSGLSAAQYKVLEREADTFAGAFIRPARLVRLLNSIYQKLHIAEIQAIFNISYSAANACINIVKKLNVLQEKNNINFFFQTQFFDFINASYCINCHYRFTSKSPNYCPICGKHNLLWYNTNLYIYDFIELDYGEIPIMDYKTYPQNIDNGRTETCPRCELENIDSDWNYCPICSLPTQNVCEDCGEKLDPHFRYCPKCGKESLYFKEKALTSWKDEYDTQHSSPTTTEASSWDEDTIPF